MTIHKLPDDYFLRMPPETQEGMDIGVWYSRHEVCPNCFINLRQMHPMANLWPHWTGQCKTFSADETFMKEMKISV